MGPARAPLWLRSKARGRTGLGGGRQPGGPALPWPRGRQATASTPSPGAGTSPEVPGCGLHVAGEGRGLCEVSTEPTPHSKQLPRVGPGSLLPPGCGRVCRAIWRLPCRSWQTQALRGFQPEKKTSWRAGSQAWLCPSQPRASSERRSWRRPSCPRGGLAPRGRAPRPPKPPPLRSHPSPPAVLGKWPHKTQASGHRVGLSEAVRPQTRGSGPAWLPGEVTTPGLQLPFTQPRPTAA